jgi:WD40-like Beta Propeller Repeat
MRRFLCTIAALLPVAAQPQSLQGPHGIGDALRTMDQLHQEHAHPRKGLDQAIVVPERPGQNQVAWYEFDWEFVDVPAPGGGKGGIRLYYYRNEAAQARRALPAIQSAFARLVDQFHYNPSKRIPYILYATQREFQTQNVFQVSESVLGVTSPEDLKMAVPYFGDHSKFVEVSTHEMVHQFHIQKMLEQAGAEDMPSAIQFLPLWFIEGIAEYYSKGGIDSETDLYLRDLVWNPDPSKGYEVLPFGEDRLRGYIPTYKLGQARIAFIAETYGKEKIQGFLENAYLIADSDNKQAPSPVRSFGALVRRVLNEPLEQVDGRWRAWMKRRYYPEYLRARQDLPQLREIRGLPYEPEDFVTSPDGSVAVIRGIDRNRGRARLFLVDLRNPRGAVEIAADNVPGIESLHPIEFSIAAVGTNVVVFAAQHGSGDRVYLIPYKHETPEGRQPYVAVGKRRPLEIRAPKGARFIQVSDPSIAPDGRELAFVGVAPDGQQDVYVVSLKGGEARRLTNDPYSEKDLSWGPDGIYYASDATDHGKTNLFRIVPATGERTRLTTAPSSDRHPSALPDGSVLFASDRGGKLDLYLLKDGATKQITDFTTGLVAPALAPKGRGVFASTFYGGTFRLVEVPKVAWLESPTVPVEPSAGDVLEIPSADLPESPRSYDAMALGNWSPEAGFVYGGGASSGVAGRAAVLFSDYLRDHVLFLDLSVLGSFELTQALALYEDRSQRTGRVLGAYHFVQQNLDRFDNDLAYYQRDFGVIGALRHPLDRFRRVEAELTMGGIQRYCLADFSPGVVGQSLSACSGPVTPSDAYPLGKDSWRSRNGGVKFTIQPTFRFGYDTIRYDFATGPLAGHSLLAEIGGGWLPGPGAVHGFAHLDAQQYFQLSGRANIGFRGAVGTSFSPNEQSRTWERTWWLTSADNLRGYYPLDVENLIGQNFYVANAELQIPLNSFVRLLIFDYVEGVAALDFGGVFDRWSTRASATDPLLRRDVGAWDARTLTGVLGVNVLFGPLLLRVHFGHPYDIGGIQTPALRQGTNWVTNVTLRYFFM